MARLHLEAAWSGQEGILTVAATWGTLETYHGEKYCAIPLLRGLQSQIIRCGPGPQVGGHMVLRVEGKVSSGDGRMTGTQWSGCG